METVLIILVVWLAIAFLAGMLIGRFIRGA